MQVHILYSFSHLEPSSVDPAHDQNSLSELRHEYINTIFLAQQNSLSNRSNNQGITFIWILAPLTHARSLQWYQCYRHPPHPHAPKYFNVIIISHMYYHSHSLANNLLESHNGKSNKEEGTNNMLNHRTLISMSNITADIFSPFPSAFHYTNLNRTFFTS